MKKYKLFLNEYHGVFEIVYFKNGVKRFLYSNILEKERALSYIKEKNGFIVC